MKSTFVVFIFSLISITTTQAQVNPKTLGLRLGSTNFGSGAELSYQHGLDSSNRLELDLGWRSNRYFGALGFSGIYHWVWNIDGGLNWYIGPGAQIGFYNQRDDSFFNEYDDSGIIVNIGGQIGIEYDFNELGVPILLSIDARPMWGLINSYYGGFGYGGALGVRYTF